MAALLLVTANHISVLLAEPVAVRYGEGVSRGFLQLRDKSGTVLADGENTQRRRGAQVVSRLVFRFRDGSSYNETTVFSQAREFRLISERRIQRGPAFPNATDLSIDGRTGDVSVRYNDNGEEKIASEHLELPPDLSNGIVQTLLKNVRADAVPHSFSYIATTPKPRMVKLLVSVAGRDRFTVGRVAYRAIHYVLKVDVGGLTGVVASVLGKIPPDSHVWIVDGDAPAFLRAEQPFFSDGPLWRIEPVMPRWDRAAPAGSR